MLANLLAIVVGLGSFTFYMAAFFLPEVHRKSDFLWSGIGLFYAVVLWFCAGQITGAVLLGQSAAVSLVLWLGWQTLLMRRVTTPSVQQTPVRISRGGGGRPRIESSPRGRIDLEYEFVEDTSGGSRRVAQSEEPLAEPPAVLPEEPEPPPESMPAESMPAESMPTKDMPTENMPAESMPTENMPVEIVPAAISPEPAADNDGDAINLGNEPGKESEDSLKKERSMTGAIPASDSAAHTQPQPVTDNLVKKVLILADWVKETLTNFRKPKPAKPMIELPPRPRSIPKATEGSWVPEDAEDISPSSPDVLSEVEQSPKTTAQAEHEEANWPDEDENWPDDR